MSRRILSDEGRAYLDVFALISRDASPSTPKDAAELSAIEKRATELLQRDAELARKGLVLCAECLFKSVCHEVSGDAKTCAMFAAGVFEV